MVRFWKESFLLFQLAIVVVLQVLSFHDLKSATADGIKTCAPTVCNVSISDNRSVSIGVHFPFGVDQGCGASEEFLLSGCNTTETDYSTQLLWNGFQQFYKANSTPQASPYISNIAYSNTSLTPMTVPQTVNITWDRTVFGTQPNDSCAVNITKLDNITQYFPAAEIDFSHSPFSASNSTSILIFGCYQIPQNTSTSNFYDNSSLCFQYRNTCKANYTDNSSFPCIEWKPTTQININTTMKNNGCQYFQLMVSREILPNATETPSTNDNNNITQNKTPRVWKSGIMQIQWSNDSIPTIDDCNSCLESLGGCGYDPNITSSVAFQCHCLANNITTPDSCPITPNPTSATDSTSNKNTYSRKIILSIAVASTVALLLLLFCFFFMYRRCRFKKSYTTDRSIPSTVTSINKIWTERANLLSRKFGPVMAKEFSYEELIRATDNFSETNCIGDGGFGAVYIGVMKDGSSVAVKRLYHDNFRRMDQFYNEMKILSTLEHPNLVKLHGFCCEHDKDLLLVFEYVANGTVSDQLHGKDSKLTRSWHYRLKIAYETAGALHYLHNVVSPPIYHRDVKTTNILLGEDYHVKLADFGLSRLVPVEVTHVSTAPQGTPGYVDPEYHTCYQLTDKSDVYSFGVVLMELVSAKLAVDMTRSKKEINLSSLALAKITAQSQHELIDPSLEIEKHPEIGKSVKAVIELAFRCLQPEKDDRPNMKEVYETLTQIWNEYRRHQESDTPKSNSGPGYKESKSVDTFFDPYNSKSDLSVAPSPADETCKLIKVKSEVNSADSSVWTNSNQSNSF